MQNSCKRPSGCTAERPSWRNPCPFQRQFKGATLWEGVVHVFDLEAHPKASRALRLVLSDRRE
jgi:hypothetical protein